uniref:LysM domain-containing protein n=1 Tax=Elaeophora elaphi TaxID=1147741 RepID=A0A0R3RHT4_9BILA
MEYTVAQSDSIERIAAVHDCTVGELMKMNRLATRMVFPGQKLLVPCPMDKDVDVISGNHRSADQSTPASGSNSHSSEGGRIRRGPGMAVQVYGRSATISDPSRTALEKHSKSEEEVEEADADCMKRFIKLKVKQITEMNGTVTGTLLVTPNALMFDPDVVHPLVVENGQDLYIMMARIEEVMSVTMFKSATILTDARDDREVHDFTHQDSSVPECSTVPATKETVNKTSKNLTDDIDKNTDGHPPRIFFDDMDLEIKRKGNHEVYIGLVGSDFKSPLIVKKGNKLDEAATNIYRKVRRSYSDQTSGSKQFTSDIALWQKDDRMNRTFVSGNDENKQQYSTQPSTSVDNARIGLTFNPLSKLGKTLSTHASTIRGSVTSGAERMTQSAMSGTKSVAQGVVSQSKAVAGTLQTGIQTSVKVAASHAITAVGAVAAMPQGIASMSSGLFSASQHPEAAFSQGKAVSKTRKEQNLATLLSLKEKAQQLREEALRNKHFFCATSMDGMLNLFRPVHELLSPEQTFSAAEKSTLTDSVYYMAVRLNREKKDGKERSVTVNTVRSSSASSRDVISNHARQEFWFAIPKLKVDVIYQFLLQWNPEKHGSNTQQIHPNKSIDQHRACELLEDYGFVVLDSETGEKFAGLLLFFV